MPATQQGLDATVAAATDRLRSRKDTALAAFSAALRLPNDSADCTKAVTAARAELSSLGMAGAATLAEREAHSTRTAALAAAETAVCNAGAIDAVEQALGHAAHAGCAAAQLQALRSQLQRRCDALAAALHEAAQRGSLSNARRHAAEAAGLGLVSVLSDARASIVQRRLVCCQAASERLAQAVGFATHPAPRPAHMLLHLQHAAVAHNSACAALLPGGADIRALAEAGEQHCNACSAAIQLEQVATDAHALELWQLRAFVLAAADTHRQAVAARLNGVRFIAEVSLGAANSALQLGGYAALRVGSDAAFQYLQQLTAQPAAQPAGMPEYERVQLQLQAAQQLACALQQLLPAVHSMLSPPWHHDGAASCSGSHAADLHGGSEDSVVKQQEQHLHKGMLDTHCVPLCDAWSALRSGAHGSPCRISLKQMRI